MVSGFRGWFLGDSPGGHGVAAGLSGVSTQGWTFLPRVQDAISLQEPSTTPSLRK